ncbi:hypothetical protein TNIN_474941 [Trichonephila inaurata madagascariensis]|uniref:Uncharacterized protein n=1 Tax=Trichonephila inaurata madagascariensis TaxID=2747483 RepID=A0A8X6X991_9ARAC|nr:hypothetical protein TNIN_474941 [Trichonephila inaurata madagascariensis]
MYYGGGYKPPPRYMVVLPGARTNQIPLRKRALISLTSTEIGLALSTCDCGENEFCRLSKERIEVLLLDGERVTHQKPQRLCYGKDDWEGDHHFPVTTPKTKSGSSTRTPCCLIFYLIACVLSLLTFRTSDSMSSLPQSTASGEIEQTISKIDLTHTQQMKSTWDSTKQWPWWWTSGKFFEVA